jgi:hypothetical protein
MHTSVGVKYRISLTATFFIIAFYYLQLKYSWPGLKTSGILGPIKYMDQDSVLNSARCFEKIGNDVYRIDAVTKECGGYVYSVELLRLLNFFNFPDLGTLFLGSALLWLTVLTLCSVFFLNMNFTNLDKLTGFFAFVSPGIWLLLERGNYDEVVFILVFVASLLLSTRFQEIGMVLLLLTALIKFYTLPMFIISIFFLKRKTSRILFGVVSALAAAYSLSLIKQIAFFPSTWFISFGLDSLGLYSNLFFQEVKYQNFALPSFAITGIGILFLGCLCFFFSKLSLFSESKDLVANPNVLIVKMYLTMLVVFLSCFIAGMNYDYRLIYLSILISLAPAIFLPGKFKKILTISGCSALALSTFSFGLIDIPRVLLQFIGDISLYIFVSTQLLYLSDLLIAKRFLR